jgi:formylglycine-generating enzyme required for sulfatase activity
LYDTHGNVWEWVEDCYQANYGAAPADGAARTSPECSRRVMRGGAWNNSEWNLRSAIRLKNSPVNRGDDLGFRVARTLNP